MRGIKDDDGAAWMRFRECVSVCVTDGKEKKKGKSERQGYAREKERESKSESVSS